MTESKGELKIRPKKNLTLIDILAITRELKDILSNTFIDKVFRLNEGLLIRCRKEAEKLYLIITKHRLGLTRYISEEEKQSEPVLRNYIERTRIVNINNPTLDRIVHFKLSNSMTLIVEMLEPLNIILIDDNGIVKWCFRKYEGKDRRIAIGIKYLPPPKQFLDPLECSVEAYLANIHSSKSFIKAAARVLGVGVELVREACVLEGINCEAEISKDHALRILYRVREIIRQILEGKLQPVIYFQDSLPVTVLPIPFRSYESLGFRAQYYRSFNEAVDEYFRQLEIQEHEETIIKNIENELQRLRKSIEQTERLIIEYEEKAKELREKAQKILMYKYSIEELLENLRRLWLENRENFSEITRELAVESVKVVDYDSRDKLVIIQVENINVAIPLHGKSLGEVIKELFEKAKELERKAESARKALNDLRRREKELLEAKTREIERFRESYVKIEYGVREWFERFKWFLTTDDRLVLAGKDASQNETLVRKYMREFDLFFHADIHGAAAVILRLRGREDEPSEEDILQAAKYAAANSRAWTLGHACVDVYFVRGEQVSKQAPPGQYLARGSFMIYGERTWIRGVELELAIGIRVDEVNADTRIVRIVSAPKESISRLCEYYIVLRPGRVDKNKIASILQDKFVSYIREKYNVTPRLTVSDIITYIPGDSTIVEEGESKGVLSWNDIKSKIY